MSNTEKNISTSKILYKPVTNTIGAWVEGVSLIGNEVSVAENLRKGLAEHGVLFFDFGRPVTSEEFSEFAKLFGEVEAGYGQQKKAEFQTEVPVIDESKTPMVKFRTDYWHSDGNPLDIPPLAALLTPFSAPESGGDTMWASMYAAWDALSPRYQNMLDGMDALHSNFRLPFLQPKQCVHPAVITEPVTGRKALYVNSNYTERLIGLTDKESDSVLRFLYEHVNSPEFHVRLSWRTGYIAVWHQFATQHRAVGGTVGSRVLKRLTIVGYPPK